MHQSVIVKTVGERHEAIATVVVSLVFFKRLVFILMFFQCTGKIYSTFLYSVTHVSHFLLTKLHTYFL